jgi:hypothetical protein
MNSGLSPPSVTLPGLARGAQGRMALVGARDL